MCCSSYCQDPYTLVPILSFPDNHIVKNLENMPGKVLEACMSFPSSLVLNGSLTETKASLGWELSPKVHLTFDEVLDWEPADISSRPHGLTLRKYEPCSFCKFSLNFSRPEGPKPSSVWDLEQPARPSLPPVYLISLLHPLACWELNVMTHLVPFS